MNGGAVNGNGHAAVNGIDHSDDENEEDRRNENQNYEDEFE